MYIFGNHWYRYTGECAQSDQVTDTLPVLLSVRAGAFIFSNRIQIQMNTDTEVFAFVFECLLKNLEVFVFDDNICIKILS